MEKKGKESSFSSRLFIFVPLVILFFSIVLIFSIYFILKSQFYHSNNQMAKVILTQTNEVLNIWLNNKISTLQTISSAENVKKICTNPTTDTMIKLRRILNTFETNDPPKIDTIQIYPKFKDDYILKIDVSGDVRTIKSGSIIFDSNELNDSIGFDASNFNYIKEILYNGKKNIVSNVYINRENPNELFFAIAVPIYDNSNNVIGAVSFNIDFRVFTDYFIPSKKMDKNDIMILVDSKGKMLSINSSKNRATNIDTIFNKTAIDKIYNENGEPYSGKEIIDRESKLVNTMKVEIKNVNFVDSHYLIFIQDDAEISKRVYLFIIFSGFFLTLYVTTVIFINIFSLRKMSDERTKINSMNRELINKNQKLKDSLRELKDSQIQLVQSEKIGALNQVISGIAHEINTPLGIIKASVEIIEELFKGDFLTIANNIKKMSNKNLYVLGRIIEHSSRTTKELPIKNMREYRTNTKAFLETKNISHDKIEELIPIILELDLYEHLNLLLPIIVETDYMSNINFAYTIANGVKSLKNIHYALNSASKTTFALRSYINYGTINRKIYTDIIDGIETVLELLSNRLKNNDIKIIKEFSAISKTYCYLDELNQVWMGLLHNSIYAIKGSGIIKITAKEENNYIVISIKDSGVGISDDVKDKIFNPFFTTKGDFGGSGVGLSIAKKVIEKHKGKISFESQFGFGTTFYVYIPIIKEMSEENG